MTRHIDPGGLRDGYRDLIHALVRFPRKMAHIERLVELGLEHDRPDDMGLATVQLAGWEGLPDLTRHFLRLKPGLGHVNGYGGTPLGTIIHGSENRPARVGRGHVACARIALEEGVALPRRAIGFAGEPATAAFLADRAEARPGQVVERDVC